MATMNKLDATLNDVQNTHFSNVYHDLIKQMSKQTQFSESEVQSILLLYHKFVLANGHKAKIMRKKQFQNLCLDLFKIYDEQIIERILMILVSDLKKGVDAAAWVKWFSVFMSNKLETKMKFVYQVYSMGPLGLLTREIVTLAVEKFFTGDDEDEINEIRSDMVEMLFHKFDVDKDGIISYDDYATVVRNKPELLQFLGECFPNIAGVTVIGYCANILSKISFPTMTIDL